ncbi:MAG: cytochrome c/FTR1 family iron permease [Burkholderiaceae bacterium]
MLGKSAAFVRLIIATLVFASGWAAAQPAVQPTAPAAAAPADARQLWQLLDYVAVDYAGAVEDGKVVSEAEYAEMLDFTENALKQLQELPEHAAKPRIRDTIAELREAVENKASAEQVAALAHRANAELIAAFPMPVAPKSLPDLARGRSLYAKQCASCHGASGNGDGPAAVGLEPPPIAFTDAERARARSLMALYQVISQGVEGTSMPRFDALADEDRWALAFYVGTLAYDEAMRERGQALWAKNDAAAKARFGDLAALTTTTEAAAAQTLGADAARDLTAYLRTHAAAVDAGKPSGLALARSRLKESLDAMHRGDKAGATRLGLSAYLDGFEPIEPVVGARDASLLLRVEETMLAYRSAVAKGATDEAEAAAAKLGELFDRVDQLLGDAKADPMTTFVGALTILLREGVEALLIVIGMVAFLKKADRRDALRHVHLGWISALVAGILTWGVATYLVDISGASREITEGLGSILAALILLSVGLWMHQKSAAGRWHEYLHGKLSAALTRRSAWALFGLSFVAVYREVFETVLFYSALASDGNGHALAAGFGVAVLLLAVIAWLLLRTSARMPIGRFFSITSVLVAVLAVVLIGKGAAALQEAGWLSVNPIALPRIELLGIYPTLETAAAQIVVALIAIAGFAKNRADARPRRG